MLKYIQQVRRDHDCLWYTVFHGLDAEHPGYQCLLQYHETGIVTPQLLDLDELLYEEDTQFRVDPVTSYQHLPVLARPAAAAR